jgi:NADPH:quinone reductase-like Zn-dependent oxidoreductase
VQREKYGDGALSIGADHVIDYTKEDFTATGEHYDLILDAVGNRTVSDNVRALRPHGICVVVGFTSMRLMLQTQLRGRWVRADDKRLVSFTAQSNQADLLALNELIESGKVKAVIDRRCRFGELSEALGYVEEGHARGKVVVTMG